MHAQPYRYLLALGANRGQRAAQMQRALSYLARRGRIVQKSTAMETAALETTEYVLSREDRAPFLNQVVDFATDLSPEALYEEIRLIEDLMGHPRHQRWAARHLDIDLLFCAENVHEHFGSCPPLRHFRQGGLEVPHRAFWEREFLCQLVCRDLGVSEGALRRHAFRGRY